jgi:cytochrome c peroxidase
MRVLVAASLCVAGAAAQTNFPPPPAPVGNPSTPNKVLLGMTLFFEEQLSSSGTVACATCHDLGRGGIDPRTLSGINPGPDGVFGTPDDQHGSPGVPRILANGTLQPTTAHGLAASVTGRRAPTVINSGYHTALAYDGSRLSLEQLIAVPPVNSVEMAHQGRTWGDVSQKIAAAAPLVFASQLPARLQNFVANRTYPQLFQLAYGATAVTQSGIVDAIATYVRTLNSDQSKWDQVMHGQAVLDAQEQQGLQLFNSPANGATACRTCHGDFESTVLSTGPRVGQIAFVPGGYYGGSASTLLLFHNVGVRPPAEDPGRQLVTNSVVDAGRFRVASLRNVELAAPYFHNGSALTLHEVLDFYDRGGDFHANQAPSLTPRNYTIGEKDAIVAILRTLTDPRIALGVYPFDRPRLGSETQRFATPVGGGTAMPSGALVAHAPFAPRLGEAWFRLAMSGATPGAWTFLMFDTALAAAPGPFDVQLGLTPAFSIFTIGPAGSSPSYSGGVVQVPLPLPANPALGGQVLFTQWLSLEPSLAWPFATSNALRFQLQ